MWVSCSHADHPHKEEEVFFLKDFGTKSLTEEDWPGDYCILYWSWLVSYLSHLEFHRALWARAE